MEDVFTNFLGTMLAIIGGWFIFIFQQKWQIKYKKYQEYIRRLSEIYALSSEIASEVRVSIKMGSSNYDRAKCNKVAILMNELAFYSYVDNKQLSPDSTKLLDEYFAEFIKQEDSVELEKLNESYEHLATSTKNTAEKLADIMEDDLNIKNYFKDNKKAP